MNKVCLVGNENMYQRLFDYFTTYDEITNETFYDFTIDLPYITWLADYRYINSIINKENGSIMNQVIIQKSLFSKSLDLWKTLYRFKYFNNSTKVILACDESISKNALLLSEIVHRNLAVIVTSNEELEKALSNDEVDQSKYLLKKISKDNEVAKMLKSGHKKRIVKNYSNKN